MCGVPSYWLDNGLEYRIDQLHKALVAMPPGLTLEEISADVFKRNVPQKRIAKAVRVLQARGLVIVRNEVSMITGKTRTVVTALPLDETS